MKKFLKTHLEFSHTEVRGLTLLLIILSALEIVRYNFDSWFPNTEFVDIQFTPFQRAWIDSLQRSDSLEYERKRYKAPHEFQGFEFDPNLLPESDWLRLGFSEKQASAIVKIRNKGFRFRKKEDLKKIFCVNNAKYRQLEPFIVIGSFQESYGKVNSGPEKKAIPITEINTADSLAFIAIKGIGPYRASKIIRRRMQLGGYYSLRQLAEIKGFDDSVLTQLLPYLTVDSSRIKRIPINSISLEELQKHPYCWYGVGKSIVNYRGNHGPFRSLADLQKIYALKPDQRERLSHYVSFE